MTAKRPGSATPGAPRISPATDDPAITISRERDVVASATIERLCVARDPHQEVYDLADVLDGAWRWCRGVLDALDEGRRP